MPSVAGDLAGTWDAHGVGKVWRVRCYAPRMARQTASIQVRMTRDEAQHLRRHLARSGLDAAVSIENPLTFTEVENQVLVVLGGTLATVTAQVLTWAFKKYQAYRAEDSKGEAEITVGDGADSVRMTASKRGVQLTGTLSASPDKPALSPRRTKTKRPKKNTKKKRP